VLHGIDRNRFAAPHRWNRRDDRRQAEGRPKTIATSSVGATMRYLLMEASSWECGRALLSLRRMCPFRSPIAATDFGHASWLVERRLGGALRGLAGCHSTENVTGSGAQAPLHSDVDVNPAHEYALTRANFREPENSKLVVRLGINRHNCQRRRHCRACA
jgi:hypothetical protein